MSCTLRIDGFTCSAGFECLTEDLEEVVGLFNEVIQEPAVQQDKVAFYKAQVCFCLWQLLFNASISQCACVTLPRRYTVQCSLRPSPTYDRSQKAACGCHTVSAHTQGVGHAAMQAAWQHVAV